MKLTKKMLTGLASVFVILFGLVVWVGSGSFTAEDAGGGGSLGVNEVNDGLSLR